MIRYRVGREVVLCSRGIGFPCSTRLVRHDHLGSSGSGCRASAAGSADRIRGLVLRVQDNHPYLDLLAFHDCSYRCGRIEKIRGEDVETVDPMPSALVELVSSVSANEVSQDIPIIYI